MLTAFGERADFSPGNKRVAFMSKSFGDELKLDGTGKNFVRLTSFNDYEGGKASNPVISSDGKFMCFQFANTAGPALPFLLFFLHLYDNL